MLTLKKTTSQKNNPTLGLLSMQLLQEPRNKNKISSKKWKSMKLKKEKRKTSKTKRFDKNFDKPTKADKKKVKR